MVGRSVCNKGVKFYFPSGELVYFCSFFTNLRGYCLTTKDYLRYKNYNYNSNYNYNTNIEINLFRTDCWVQTNYSQKVAVLGLEWIVGTRNWPLKGKRVGWDIWQNTFWVRHQKNVLLFFFFSPLHL